MIPVEELERVEFLRALGPYYLNQVARLAQLEEYPEDTVLFHEGQDSPYLYFVLSGQVSLEVHLPEGNRIQVATANPGELLGWSQPLERRSMTATARAKTLSRLALLKVPQIMELSAKDPRFAVAFFRQVAKVLSDRLYATRRYLGRVLCHLPPSTIVSEGSD